MSDFKKFKSMLKDILFDKKISLIEFIAITIAGHIIDEIFKLFGNK